MRGPFRALASRHRAAASSWPPNSPLEFMPLWVVMLADLARSAGRGGWVGLGLVAVGAHNWFAFYVPFR